MSSRSSSPHGGLNRVSVIKWTEILSGLPRPAAPTDRRGTATRARRRQRRAPGLPPPRSWPVPGPRPSGPLPDPTLLRLCAVPDPTPPYDDEPFATTRCPADGDASFQGGGPGEVRRDAAVARDPETPAGPPGLFGTRHGAGGPGPDGEAGPGSGAARADPSGGAARAGPSGGAARPPQGKTAGSDTAATVAWPSVFAQVLAETLAGSRPSRQLTPWTTQRARGHIRRLGPLLADSRNPSATGREPSAAGIEPRVRRVVSSRPSADVVEMAVIVRFGPRVRAIAIRLERGARATGNDWLCTAIEAA
jgi:Family of unknown function (DUF6459)